MPNSRGPFEAPQRPGRKARASTDCPRPGRLKLRMLKRKGLYLALLLTTEGGATIAQTFQFESRPQLDVYRGISNRCGCCSETRSFGITPAVSPKASSRTPSISPCARILARLEKPDNVSGAASPDFGLDTGYTTPLGGITSAGHLGHLLEVTPRHRRRANSFCWTAIRASYGG